MALRAKMNPMFPRSTSSNIRMRPGAGGMAIILCMMATGCKSSQQESSQASPAPVVQGPDKSISAITALIGQYANADNCSQRLEYILNPSKNKEALTSYYADTKSCVLHFQSIDASDCSHITGDRCSVKVTTGSKAGDILWHCIVLTPQGPKVDWRCSVGYNPLPMKTFQALHDIGKRARFRVWAELTDYYNYQYSEARKTMYSVRLGADLYGYVKRDSDLGRRMFDLLKDGKAHAVVVEVVYGRNSRTPSIADITDLPHRGWSEYDGEF